MHPRLRIAALAALLVLPCAARAQSSGDDSLDRLLEKLEAETKSPDGPAEGGEPKPGEVSAEDRSLDRLLEKLGGTEDEPAPDGRPPMPGAGPAGQPEPGQPGTDGRPPEGGKLEGEEKELDLGQERGEGVGDVMPELANSVEGLVGHPGQVRELNRPRR